MDILLKTFIVTPVKIVINIIKWFIDVVAPILDTIITTTPLNIIFLIGILITVAIFILHEQAAQAFVLNWELHKLLANIANIILNTIVQLFYNLGVPIYNNFIDGFFLFFELFINGICDNPTEFADVANCDGFSDLILTLEMIKDGLWFAFGFSTIMLTTIYGALSNIVCDLPDCSDKCETPSCDSWGPEIRPAMDIKGNYLYDENNNQKFIINTGPFGIRDMSSSLTRQEIFMIQITAKIYILGFQILIKDILPNLILVMAWSGDMTKVIMTTFLWAAVWFIDAISRILGKVFYVIVRAFLSVLEDETKIDFSPGYYDTNITGYSRENQDDIRDSFMDDFMANATDFFILRDDMVGSKWLRDLLIRILLGFKFLVENVVELPYTIIAVIDKYACLIVNIFFCLPIDGLCDIMFAPTLQCVVAVRVERNFDNFPVVTYRYMGEGIEIQDFYTIQSNGGITTPIFETGTCLDPISGEDFANRWILTSGVKSNWKGIDCLEYPNIDNLTVYDDWVPHRSSSDNYPYGPDTDLPPLNDPRCVTENGLDVNCHFWLKDSINLNYWGAGVYEHVYDNNQLWCGSIFRVKDGGILFPDQHRYRAHLDWLDDIYDFFGGDLWGELAGIGTFFYDTCNDLFDHDCPCLKCESHESQYMYYVDFIPGIKGYPGNPKHPIPSKRCAVDSPSWRSFFWTIDEGIFNIMDETNITIT